MKLTERLAWRLQRDLILTTEHGDEIRLADYEADALAEIIEEFVDAKICRALEDAGKSRAANTYPCPTRPIACLAVA